MIVVVVLGILAILAYSSYERQMTRTRRSEAMTALLNSAQALERCYSRFGSYNNAGCDVGLPYSTENGFYTIAAAATAAATFSLSATPTGVQTRDTDCGVLRYASNGQRGSLDSATTDANGCW
jgi:type IV pilus assembly protein PilE